MNPHRKYKNHGPDNFGVILLAGILCFVTFGAAVLMLNPVHKNNIEKPLAQQYALKQSDQILFCKPDEIGWTRGQVLYLWGYYPIIFSQDLNKTFEFKEVVWMVGND